MSESLDLDKTFAAAASSGLSYAQYFTITTPIVQNDEPLPIDKVSISSKTITADTNANTFTIENAGIYLFSWWFDTKFFGTTIELILKGSPDKVINVSSQTRDNISVTGNCIYNVPAKSIFQFQNRSNARIILQNNGNGTSGTIAITQLG